jgi:hypothetical protein
MCSAQCLLQLGDLRAAAALSRTGMLHRKKYNMSPIFAGNNTL